MSPNDVGTILMRMDSVDERLERIEAHVSQTNGRVHALELWRARWEGARAAMSWVPLLLVGLATGAFGAAVGAAVASALAG